MTGQELQHQAEQFESYFRKDSVHSHVGDDFFVVFRHWAETKQFEPADELSIRSRAHGLLYSPRAARPGALEQLGRAG